MKQKKHSVLQSQIVGIVWLSIGLLLILAVAFFLPRRDANVSPIDSLATVNKTILDQKEDSLYQSRRQRAVYQGENFVPRQSRTVSRDTLRYDATPHPVRQPLVVELNSADTTTLMLLHGIGPAYASRIVRYRERLGGFVDVSQLLEVYGFTPELLHHIAPYIKLDTLLVQRLPVNSIALKQLVKHPYIEYYQARDIVVLRNQGVQFHSLEDLRAVPSMADSTLQRLAPYLDFAQ